MNKAFLTGNLGKDPEVIILNSKKKTKKASFSLATTATWYNEANEKQTRTEWHNVIVWGKQADTIEKYVKKGTKLMIEGEIRYREYLDAKKEKRYITEIYTTAFEILSPKKDQPDGVHASEVPVNE
jgi:single-strand DNA-binding protein